MKSLLELYTLLLEHFKANNVDPNVIDSNSYICNNIEELVENWLISDSEYELLKNHFQNEEPSPTKHTAFYEHPLFIGDFVWFSCNRNPELAFSLRVQLLTNIIADLKDGSN